MKESTKAKYIGDLATVREMIVEQGKEEGIDITTELGRRTLSIKADPHCPTYMKVGIAAQIMLTPAYCPFHTCDDAEQCVRELAICDLDTGDADPFFPEDVFLIIDEFQAEQRDRD